MLLEHPPILASALYECQSHATRLHYAWQKATEFIHQHQTMQSLNDLEVQILDQAIYRFSRLQNALAKRLLPAILHLLAEWQEGEPFLDKVHRAEKLTIIPSAEEWAVFREARNQIAYEYPEQSEKMLQNQQHLVSLTPGLLALHQHMTDFIRGRFSA